MCVSVRVRMLGCVSVCEHVLKRKCVCGGVCECVCMRVSVRV